jgi:two-component system response regulator RegA
MVRTVETVADALSHVERSAPEFAVVDMRLNDGSGLDVVSALTRTRPDARAIVLTGYGNIASAVNAIKCGAANYLAKPADTDEILGALLTGPHRELTPPVKPMSPNRVRWEHIQRVFELCGRNVSDTARRLRMHRRTLQRILAKRAPQ